MAAAITKRSVAAARHASTSTTTSSLPERLDTQVHQLPDGRSLGFAEYGSPTGHPVLFFHGFPSCRLEAYAVDQPARRLGLRIISLDRPGFGLSTFQPGRHIMDWPADVSHFAKTQRLDRFSVLGGSGGGPYALACALGLEGPGSPLAGVGVMAGAPPWEDGNKKLMTWPRRALRVFAKYTPWLCTVFLNGFVGLMKWAANTQFVTTRVDAFLLKAEEKRQSEKNKEEVDNQDGLPPRTVQRRREDLYGALFGGFTQGAKACTQETTLLTEPWGIKFEDITQNPVKIWHGEKDTNAPIEAMRWMAKRIPHTDFKEFGGTDHYQVGHRFEEILAEMVPKK